MRGLVEGVLVALALLALVALLPSADALVTLEGTPQAHGTRSTTETVSYSYTQPSTGSDRLLTATILWKNGNDAQLSSVTYGGVSLTCMSNPGTAPNPFLNSCHLVDPPTGSNDLSISWNKGAQEHVVVIRSWAGVHQTDTVGATSRTAGSSSTASTTLTTTTSDSQIIGGVAAGALVTMSPLTGVTEDAEQASSSSGALTGAAGRQAASNPASYTFGWSLSASTSWYTVAREFNPAPIRVQWGASTSSHAETDGTVNVPVTLSSPHSSDVTVDVAVTGGTATGGGTDYTLDTATVTVPAGSTTANAAVTIADDSADERDETVELTVSNPTGGAILGSPTAHTLTILDDDNQPPVANDQSFTTDEDTAFSATLDASDPGADDVLTYAITTNPTKGTVALDTATGGFTYTPNANANGADSFKWTATDDAGATSNTATASITINAVNDAPVANDDDVATDEDTAVTVNVLADDEDVDGDTLSVSGTTSPTHGSVTVNADDTITYTPDPDYHGLDSFTYTASDGSLTDGATVTVVVNSVNDAPVATDDSGTTDEDTPVTVDVLANDDDVDGDTLVVSSATIPANGAVSINNDGTVTYTPDPDYHGADSFTYTASDGSLTDTATVSVTVNSVEDAPTAVDDAPVTDEDTAVTVAVLANDFDGDGDPIEITTVSTPSDGSATLNADDTITYTPDPDYNGADAFTYTITDGSLTDTATVSITVNAVNDAPVARDDPTVTVKDTSVTVRVLANDDDVDADALSVASVTQPSDGSVEMNGDGTVTYEPDRGFLGSDSFRYTVTDGALTDEARVPVEVVEKNDAPVARDDEAETPEDTPVVIDVLANDEDPNGNVLRVISVTAPGNGSSSIDGRSTVRYTPDPDVHGSDVFRYTVTDGSLTAQARITVAINPVNDAPVARDDEAETEEDEPVTVDLLANDDDVDGNVLSITQVDAPGHGAVTLTDAETVIYTPDPDYNGVDAFTYSVTDENLTATGRVRVTVHPVNDPPVARDDDVRTPEATPVDVRVLANDEDVDGDTLEVVSVTEPASGEAEVTATNLVRYTPDVGFEGRDSFRYRISDGELTDDATVRVTVGPIPDGDLPPGVSGFDASGATVLRPQGASAELAWPRVPAAEGYQVWRWNGTGPPSPAAGTAGLEAASTTTAPSWVQVATLSPDTRTFTVARPDAGQPPAWYKVSWFPTFGGDAHLKPGEDPSQLDGWNSTAAIQVDPSGDGVDRWPPGSGLDWGLWWLVVLATATVTVGTWAAWRRRHP